MQLILAILAILLYAAVYAVGFIVAGIVELVKYIKKHKEDSRKAAKQNAKKISALKQKESQNNLPQAALTSPKQIQTRDIILPSEDTPDLQDTIVDDSSISTDKDIDLDTYDDEEDVVDVLPEETIVSTSEDITISSEPLEVKDSSNALIGDIILSLQEHLCNKVDGTEDITTDIAIEESDKTDALLGSLIEALTRFQIDRLSDDDKAKEGRQELIEIISSLKSNAELKRKGILSILEALSIAKTDIDTTLKENATSETKSDDRPDIVTHVESITPNPVAQSEEITNDKDGSKKNKATTELAIFNNLIYHIKLLGHEDPRFKLIAIKAYEIISKFGDSPNFFMDILCATDVDDDFAMEVIRFIAAQKILEVPDNVLIQKIRQQYITDHKPSVPTTGNVFKAKPKSETAPLYIEVETSQGSQKLTAKSKIAHKHKAIQYANIIGGKLLDGYTNSDDSSFTQFITKHCKSIADRGDCSLTTEEFEPYRNIIATYKKSKKKKNNPRNVATSIITPKRSTTDNKANIVLRIIDKLTSSRLPRYEIPTVPSTGEIVQREYKKTNPFDVYNDLVSSEYNLEALNDKRFAILYQLIMFISECVENGMTEEETLTAISSLRVVNKRDLYILRDREIRFKGLSKKERKLVLDSELCNNREMTNLYVDLIHHYKSSGTKVSLNEYIIGVLLKNYKESNAAWRLLKYIYLKTENNTDQYIVDNRWAIMENYFITDSSHSIKDMNDAYYLLDESFIQLKYDYDHCIGMTQYNFQRDKITTDMLNVSTLKQYLPKRFDSKGRLCVLAMVSPIEADLFKSFDKLNTGNHMYLLLPVASLTTKDLYGLLLTVKKQKRKLN